MDTSSKNEILPQTHSEKKESQERDDTPFRSIPLHPVPTRPKRLDHVDAPVSIQPMTAASGGTQMNNHPLHMHQRYQHIPLSIIRRERESHLVQSLSYQTGSVHLSVCLSVCLRHLLCTYIITLLFTSEYHCFELCHMLSLSLTCFTGGCHL